MYYTIGTQLVSKKVKREAQLKKLKDDLINTLFWVALITMFTYCLFA